MSGVSNGKEMSGVSNGKEIKSIDGANVNLNVNWIRGF